MVTSRSFQPAGASSRATRCTSSRVWRERGLRSEACSSAQQKAEATSIAVYCQTVPLVPLEAPDVEAVQLDLLARLGGVDVPRGRRDRRTALVGVAVAGDQRQALGARVQPDATSTRQTPCSEIRSPPHFSRASSAEIRRGP